MDIVSAQAKLNRGFGKIAHKLGRPFAWHRPLSAADPVSIDTIMGTVPVYLSDDPNLTPKPAKFASPLTYGAYDATDTREGDYFVRAGGETVFISDQGDLTPPVLIKCNATITIFRPKAAAATSAKPYYGGNTKVSGTVKTGRGEVLASGWPCSLLEGTKGEKSVLNLPNDTRNPWYELKLPAIPGVSIQSGDQIEDEHGHRLVISSVELTSMGYRLTVGYWES